MSLQLHHFEVVQLRIHRCVTDLHWAEWIRFNELRVKRQDIMMDIGFALLATKHLFEVCGKGLPEKHLSVIGFVKGARTIQKLDGPFAMVVKVTRISEIIFIAAIDIISLKRMLRTSALFLLKFFI